MGFKKKKAPVEAPADGADAAGGDAVADGAASTDGTDADAAAAPACHCRGKQAYALNKYQLSSISCAINYSGRALELGGIVNSVYQRRSSLSRCERPPFSS